ncbi:MAG: prenyltransferase/squalene oxidase repeat-containing protein [Rhodanobacter sp.]
MADTSTVVISHDRLASALQRARDYLLERQSPGGGFCFYRGYYLEEPNLADTWHGVAALTGLLGVELAQPKQHADFVIGQAVESQPLALYYRVRALLALHTTDPAAAKVTRTVATLQLELPDPARLYLLGSALRRLHYVLWLKKHFGMDNAAEDVADRVLALANEDGGYGAPSNLLDTADAIAVLSLCGVTAPAITGQFVTAMADPQFGFRLVARFPSSSLEIVHAGSASCHRLNLVIPYAAAATDFVLSCQSGSGGFARASGALPDMTLTYTALTTLLRYLQEQSTPAAIPSCNGTE